MAFITTEDQNLDTEKQTPVESTSSVSAGPKRVLEDGHVIDHGHLIENDHVVDPNDAGELKVLEIRQKFPVLRWLRDWEQRLDQRLGVEGQGVERIPEEKRHPPSKLNVRRRGLVCNVSQS